MPVAQTQSRDVVIAGPLGGLLLSSVRAHAPMMIVRALRWYRDLARLGVNLPLFVVHDIGLLYAAPREQLTIGVRVGARGRRSSKQPRLLELHRTYRTIVDEIAQSEASARARTMRLSDDLVVVVLARVLGAVAQRIGRPPYPATIPLDPEMVRDIDAQLPVLFSSSPRTFEAAALDGLSRARLHVLTLADALDLDTLRLLGMLGPESSAAGALAHVDLLSAISSPAANDIVNFSLELLPSVLETRRANATGTHAVHGYSGIGNKGSLDSLVLTELAWDDEEFARRMLENEILYYTREQAPDEARRLHYLLIDASAIDARRTSGLRARPRDRARQKAAALGRRGVDALLRFASLRRAARAPRPTARGVPARLQGRARTKPCARLRAARDRDRAPSSTRVARSGRCTSSRTPRFTSRARSSRRSRARPTSSASSSCRAAASSISNICDLLEGHAVVDHATLQQKRARAEAATKIVDQASKVSARVSVPPASMGASVARRDDAVPPSLRGTRSVR